MPSPSTSTAASSPSGRWSPGACSEPAGAGAHATSTPATHVAAQDAATRGTRGTPSGGGLFVRAYVRAAFEYADADRDGAIESTELPQALDRAGITLTSDQATRAATAFSIEGGAGGGGRISLEGFAQLVHDLEALQESAAGGCSMHGSVHGSMQSPVASPHAGHQQRSGASRGGGVAAGGVGGGGGGVASPSVAFSGLANGPPRMAGRGLPPHLEAELAASAGTCV